MKLLTHSQTSTLQVITWVSNYIHYKVLYEITYPFSNFNSATFEVLGMDK